MKNISRLILYIAGCELVGIVSTPFTISAIPGWYAYLNKPFFSPPNWVFGPVWTLLYALMGIAFFIIWNSKNSKYKKYGLNYFYIQLVLNFLWTFLFFGLKSPLSGLIGICALLLFIVLTIINFYKVSKPAAFIFLPYLMWVSFATLLNASVYLLN